MARAPQVVSTVPLEIPRQSLQSAAAPYEALANVGGAVEEWGARQLELQRHREAMQKSLDASLAADQAYREESANPDHTDLDLRMKGRLEEIHKEYTGSIKSAMVKREFERSFDSLTLDKMINARAEKGRREIEAYRGTWRGRMDYLAERGAMASGPELDAIVAEAHGQTDAAVVNQSLTPDQAAQEMRQWLGDVYHVKARQDIEAASLDPSTAGDMKLLDIKESLGSGKGYEGLDPLRRQQLAEMTDDVIAQRMRASEKGWPNDPETATSVSNAIHTAGAPRITHSEIMSLYYPGRKLTWDTAHMLAGELDSKLASDKEGGDPDKPADLGQRQQQAEQEFNRIFGVDGPFAVLSQLDQNTRQTSAVAFQELGRLSSYFRRPGDTINHQMDPMEEAIPAVKTKYLPMMLQAGQGYVSVKRRDLRAGPGTPDDPLGLEQVKRRIGSPQDAAARGELDAWQATMEEIDSLTKIQQGLDEFNPPAPPKPKGKK